MKHISKLIIIIIISAFAIGSLTTLNSCRYSTYKNYHKIQKQRRVSRSMHYSSNYQRKFKRSSVPIHRNYIIKNARRTSQYYFN